MDEASDVVEKALAGMAERLRGGGTAREIERKQSEEDGRQANENNQGQPLPCA